MRASIRTSSSKLRTSDRTYLNGFFSRGTTPNELPFYLPLSLLPKASAFALVASYDEFSHPSRYPAHPLESDLQAGKYTAISNARTLSTSISRISLLSFVFLVFLNNSKIYERGLKYSRKFENSRYSKIFNFFLSLIQLGSLGAFFFFKIPT